jgi:transcriptional regulator with XRE-family HTH domain
MMIDNLMTDDQILGEIGQRISQLRLAKNMTQKELALEAGVGNRTIQRLETGNAATRLTVLIRICKALGVVERLDLFLPEPSISPIALLKHKGKQRKRASGSHAVEESHGTWKWGDET